MKDKYRNSSIELFRIILMVFIVGFHVINTGTLHPKNPLSLGDMNFLPSVILDAIFVVAVNCFILISGYFMINATKEKFLNIYAQVITYSVIGSLAFAFYYWIFDPSSLQTTDVFKSFVPILSKRYWFFTAYVILFLATPALNFVIRNFEKKALAFMLGWMIFFFSIAPSIGFTILDGRGFNFLHFILLYFIGAYIKLYVTPPLKYYLTGYILSIILIVMYTCLLDLMGRNAGYITASFAYNNILVLLSSICLFGVFLNIKLKFNPYINYLSSLVFGVYLFHEHPQVKRILYQDIFQNHNYYDSIWFIPNLLLTVLVVLILGLFIEHLRVKYFKNNVVSVLSNITDFIIKKLKLQ